MMDFPSKNLQSNRLEIIGPSNKKGLDMLEQAGFNVSQKDLSNQVSYFQYFGTGETTADEDGRREEVVLNYYYDIE